MTRKELLEKITPEEFKQWVAYFSLEDGEYMEEIQQKVAMEDMENKTKEQLAKDMKAMLMGLNN